jgi:peptidyl-prolyl cis-trans isomerase B (cyclophilin B)
MPAKRYSAPPELQIETNRTYHAVIKTNKGDIHLELNPAEAPLTVNNFVVLARDGYYDGVTFHRVVPRFVIQGGDPTGTGSGGPGYNFKDEAVTRPYKAGTVAMANAGPNTNGSQFFICLEDQPGLPPNYTIFGDTVTGMDVVRNIRVGDVMQSVTIE